MPGYGVKPAPCLPAILYVSCRKAGVGWVTATGIPSEGEEMSDGHQGQQEGDRRGYEKLKNWGRWGKDDQVGTLNHVTPEDIVKAASLIRTGKVFALGIPLDANGRRTDCSAAASIRSTRCWRPAPTPCRAAGWNKIRYADDTLMLCVQGATHWDALGHVFYEDKAYNGHDAKLIDSKGLNVLGIEHSKNKMVGRGVLLDIARFRGVQ